MRGGEEVAIFVLRRARTEVLACRRAEPLDGYWHTVAGGVEPGETAEDAARRELHEETGLTAPLTPLRTSYDYPLAEEPAHRRSLYAESLTSVHVEVFLVDAPDDWEPQLDWEHDDYRWCTPAEADALLHWADTRQALRELLARS
jgi:8-oxo-dGTP pyrophosphatase MutT (NUDIX family)